MLQIMTLDWGQNDPNVLTSQGLLRNLLLYASSVEFVD